MQTIKIFLASSIELSEDREKFEAFIARKSNLWQERLNISLKLIIWEDFIDAVAKTRLQDEYDEAIRSCDVFVMLFWSKVGKYTDEEFATALKQFLATDKPLVYTYFNNSVPAESRDEGLKAFLQKLKDLGHFETVYQNTDRLLVHFGMQLDKHFLPALAGATPAVASQGLKQKIFDLIDQDEWVDAFQELDEIFIGKNTGFNVLKNEYIHPSNNFNKFAFVNQLKIFINQKIR